MIYIKANRMRKKEKCEKQINLWRERERGRESDNYNSKEVK